MRWKSMEQSAESVSQFAIEKRQRIQTDGDPAGWSARLAVMLALAAALASGGCGAILASQFDSVHWQREGERVEGAVRVTLASDPASAQYRVGSRTGTTPDTFDHTYSYRMQEKYRKKSFPAWLVGTVLDIAWLSLTTYAMYSNSDSAKGAYVYAPVAAFVFPGYLTWDLLSLKNWRERLSYEPVIERGRLQIEVTKAGYLPAVVTPTLSRVGHASGVIPLDVQVPLAKADDPLRTRRVAQASDPRIEKARRAKAAVRAEAVERIRVAATDGDVRKLLARDLTALDWELALFWGAAAGADSVVAEALKQGAKATVGVAAGLTALHVAAGNGNVGCVELLLDAGVDPNLRASRSLATPLHLVGGYLVTNDMQLGGAYRSPNVDAVILGTAMILPKTSAPPRRIAKLLLARGADVEAKANCGQTPLFTVVSQFGDPGLVKILLDAGAKPDTQNCHQRQPLHTAAERGWKHVAAVLLEAGVDVDARDSHQQTPLHLAASCSFADCAGVATVLLDHGADIDAVTDSGWTALGSARGRNGRKHADVAAVLEARGGRDVRGTVPGRR